MPAEKETTINMAKTYQARSVGRIGFTVIGRAFFKQINF